MGFCCGCFFEKCAVMVVRCAFFRALLAAKKRDENGMLAAEYMCDSSVCPGQFNIFQNCTDNSDERYSQSARYSDIMARCAQ